ncbi:hypothetical protein BHE74_00046065 [Ensete ventricosum]|nr:hypothetical protein BHE74_00046065 [Ensete ventricosum]
MTSCWYGMIFHTDLYRPYQTVHIGPPGYRYVYHPLLGGTAKIDRRRSIEGEKGKKKKKRKRRKKKKKKKKKKRRREEEYFALSSLAHCRRPRAVVARTPSPPAGRPWVIFLLHGEKDRGDGSPKTGPCLTPAEVLIAIHGIDPVKDGMPLKKELRHRAKSKALGVKDDSDWTI